MRHNHLFRWFFTLFLIFFLFSSCTDGKGFGGRGGGGGRGGFGGSRGGSFGGSKGAGSFGGSSSYGRYNSMGKPRSGSSYRSNARSFGVGVLGGVAAYSMMRSMSSSYRSGYYEPGYGYGSTCVNNEDLNGTRFGSFRCPLNGFPLEARYCCGEYGKQFCCIGEGTNRSMRGTSSIGWIFLVILIGVIVMFLFSKHRRQRQKDMVMVPAEVPPNEQQGTPFYQPPVPPMGYPPAPSGNPYAVPPQNYEGNFTPYPQQYQPPYPPQPQQQNSYQPTHIKEDGPPAYDDAVRNNQGMPTTKPT